MAKVREAKITDFQPDPANPNKGSERGYRMLNDSLRKLGAGRSIVVDKNGYVIAGNKTQENAVDIGLEDALVIQTDGKQIVVVQRTDLDLLNDPEQKARHLSIADNRTSDFMEWDAEQIAALVDADMNLSDWFQQDELAELLAGLDSGNAGGDDPGADVDRAGELQVKWQTSRGQVWEIPSLTTLGRCHRVMCGDSTSAEDVARLMGGNKTEMVFTDPPYATFASSTGKLEMGDFNMLLPFWRDLLQIIKDTLAPGRACFICTDWRTYPSLFGVACEKLAPKNLIVWSFGGAIKMGSHFRPSYELIVYALNSKSGQSWSAKNKKYDDWKIDDRAVPDLWTIPQKEAAPGINREHSSQKPTELVCQAINNGSDAGESVLDLFLGSGTTLVACEQTGRIGYGMEIDPGYTGVILERLSGMGLAPRVAE